MKRTHGEKIEAYNNVQKKAFVDWVNSTKTEQTKASRPYYQKNHYHGDEWSYRIYLITLAGTPLRLHPPEHLFVTTAPGCHHRIIANRHALQNSGI